MTAFRRKVVLCKSSTISAASLLAFVAVLFMILFSNQYMNTCVSYESEAQKNRTELRALGEALAEASDYLTDEVRQYAITGDLEYLYNYWYEVEDERRRDTVIDELVHYNLPQQEKALLEQAKSYSDLLIETETYSMEMVLLSSEHTVPDGIDEEKLNSYLSHVMAVELPDVYASLSRDEMALTAVQILYDSSYESYKTQIMTPIEQFQEAMNRRLDLEVAESTAGRKFASSIQIGCSVIALILIGGLLFALHWLYIRPLRAYTEDLENSNSHNEHGKMDLSKVRVSPKGAYELKEFGRLFNNLSFVLQQELEHREKAEQEMRLARDEADQANNAKSDFLARMSHEMRTPLNAIIGYLYLLSKSELDGRQKRYCNSIHLASENLLAQINDVLDFSKIESGNLTFEKIQFHLPELIQEVCAVMENEAKQKRLSFQCEISGKLPSAVQGDPAKLRQLLINLVGNAVKFTQEGAVTLSVCAAESDTESCTVEFAVCDTGIGIQLEELEKIFEPFVQSDAGVTRKYGGTGLGLAICRRIVETASGGQETLQVESQPGKGSRFHFRMRFARMGDAVADLTDIVDDPIVSDAETLQSGKTVLLVDDNEINLAMEKEIIETYGVAVTVAQSGAEALRAAEQASFSLIFMDIRMPDMDGYEAAQKIRRIERHYFTPIVALSADAVSGVNEKVRIAGMNDYATKPLKPEKLKALLKKYFDLAADTPVVPPAHKENWFAWEECLQNLGGNEALLIKLAEKFLHSQKNSAQYIAAHVRRGSYGNANKILHDLLGLSGNLCCHELYRASKALKSELAEGQSGRSLDAFLEVWHQTQEAMQTYLDAHKPLGTEQDENMNYTALLERFGRLCQAYDITAVEVFEHGRPLFKQNMEREQFRTLEELVEKYEFEQIVRLLND